MIEHNTQILARGIQRENSKDGRVPGSATYTKIRVGQSDSIKLSLLHGSRNHKLLQGEGIKIIIYLCCMEVGTKVVVRATLSKIPKWALCGLYKNSGLDEMRLMG